jgi:ribose transport system permease protein
MATISSVRTWFTRLERDQRSVIIAYGMVLLLLVVCTLFVSPNFTSSTFLAQQGRQASFLGIIAAGQMLVILTGNIDLSVSWTLNLAAVLATSQAAGRDDRLWVAVLVALGVGLLVGTINGVGVAYLRIPSMVLTLGMNILLKGITVVYTGSAPQFQQTPEFLSYMATEIIGGLLPLALVIWLSVSLGYIVLLHRSALGRKIYAVGNNEVAAYLSGIKTPQVLVAVFALSGMMNALAGLMLAGNAGRSFNEMGEPYLLPAIAAVVIGGTSIAGGAGRYIGTIAGVIIIRLLESALNIVQVSPAAKDITFGVVILGMVLLYGRGEKQRE